MDEYVKKLDECVTKVDECVKKVDGYETAAGICNAGADPEKKIDSG